MTSAVLSKIGISHQGAKSSGLSSCGTSGNQVGRPLNVGCSPGVGALTLIPFQGLASLQLETDGSRSLTGFPEKIVSPLAWTAQDFQHPDHSYVVRLNQVHLKELDAAIRSFQGMPARRAVVSSVRAVNDIIAAQE